MNTAPDQSSPDEDSPWKWLTGGWAKGIFAAVLAAVVFYVEEDWRGAMAWQEAQAEIAAAGESLDPAKFIPPTIPDEENFGALPIFKLESDPSGYNPKNLSPLAMNRALVHVDQIPSSKDEETGSSFLPYLGNWRKGEPTDLPAIQKRLTELCRTDLPITPLPANATPAQLFELLCPALADLRAANQTYPLCRFNEDYTSEPPPLRPLGGVVAQIKMAKVLSYEERLALLDKQPGLALDDMNIDWKIDSGLRKEPLLISGLVSIGVVAIQLGVVTEGLAEHDWNDRHLAQLDTDLGKIDRLREFQNCVRGEVALFMIPTVDYTGEHRTFGPDLFFFDLSPVSMRPPWVNFFSKCASGIIPNGWFDDYKATYAKTHLLGTIKMVDPASRRVFPEKEAHALRYIEDAKGTSYWRDFLTSSVTPTIHGVRPFAYAQVQVDEARIACRLERYRLAHGAYPDSLTALIPDYGADLPRDVMNGEPYHYKPMKDGTYLLYSVGWDQIDDGGKQSEAQYHSPIDDPDWVWGNHPGTKK